MKKVLLGTTALVAAAAFAGIGVAQADDEMMAEPVSVSVGGYYTAAVVVYDGDDIMDGRGHSIQQNNEFNIGGSTTLDNGMTAGVRARLTTNDYEHSDEREVFFSGGFGSIHLGNIEGASMQAGQAWVPGGSVPIGGITSPWFGGIGGSWTTNAIMNEDSTKIVYFAPSFNGLGIAVSYAPENGTSSYPDGFLADDVTTNGENSEQISAALSYSMDIGGGSVSANVGMEEYTAEGNAMGVVGDSPSAMRYGAVVSVDQIAIGASLHDQDMGGGTENSYTEFGASWSEGPLMLGVQHATRDLADGSSSDMTALNINYNMGPGVDLGLQAASGSKAGADFSQILLGTMFNF